MVAPSVLLLDVYHARVEASYRLDSETLPFAGHVACPLRDYYAYQKARDAKRKAVLDVPIVGLPSSACSLLGP